MIDGDDVGTLRILNAHKGDLRIVFRPDESAAERKKTAAMIRDLIRRGYALLVEDTDGRYTRAVDFDPEARAYVVQGLPDPSTAEGEGDDGKKEPKPRKTAGRKKATRRLAASGTRAVAVGRSAGG